MKKIYLIANNPNFNIDIMKNITLEKDDKVVIHDVTRTGIGSLFIEGYSIISWSPVILS